MKARLAVPSTPAALAAVSATAALGFDRVFRDGGYVLPLLGAALIPHAIGRIVRRRSASPVLAIVASFAALALYAAWYGARGTTFAGFPTAATPDVLGQTLRDGWHLLRDGIAPVPASTDAVLLALVTVWVMATTADALTFSAGASIGALVPSLVVFVIASSLGPEAISVWTVAPYVAAVLWFLSSRHRDLLAERRSWFTVSGPGRASGASAPATGLGAAAVAIGLVLTPLLPGATSGPLLDYKQVHGGGGYQSSQNPLVDIKARLTRDADTELFTVASPARLYWRQVALDQFDGTEWTISSTSRAAGEVLHGAGDAPTVTQDYAITGLYERWLPAAYEPVAISLDDTRVVPESRTLVHADDDVVGLDYRVESRVPPATPTAAEIAGTARELPVVLQRYTALPDDLPSVVRRTAREITVGAATPYEQAEALEQFFTDGSFTYDLEVPPTSGSDAIGEFLAGRRGFCQQFAGTFGAMARAIGLPTRIVVGFTPGELGPEEAVYRVTGRNAHSWPEVWLAGLGWTSFEPTPAGTQPGATDPTPVVDPAPAASAPGTPTTTRAPVPPPTVTPAAGSGSVTTAPAEPKGAASRVGSIALFAGVLALMTAIIGLVAWGLGTVVRDRHRRSARRNGPARPAVVGAWYEAVDQLAMAGVAVSAAQTPREVVAGLDDDHGLAVAVYPTLARMADAASEALWAGRPPDEPTVARVWVDLDVVKDTLADRTPRLVRIRRAFSPAPGRTTRPTA